MSLNRPRLPQPAGSTRCAPTLSIARGRPRRRRPVRRPGHERRRRGVGPEHRPRPRRPRRPARRGLRRDRPVARDGRGRSPGRPASRSPRRPSSGGPTSAADLDAGAALPPPVTVLGIDPTVDARLHDLALVAGSPLRDPDEHSALITERLAAQDGLAVGSPLTMQGAGDRIDLPRRRHHRRRRTADRRLRPDRRRPARHRAGRLRRDRRDPRRHRPDRPGATAAAVSAALESRLTTQPYVLSSPQDLAAALRSLDRRLPGDDRADRRDRPVRRRVPDLQHAVDDRHRAHPRGRPAARRRRAPRPGHVVHAHPGAGPRRHRVAARAWSSASLLAIGMVAFVRTVGSVTLERPAVPLDAVADRARSSGVGVTLAAALEPARRASRIQPVEALTGAARPAGRAQRPAALAGRRSSSSSRSSASSSCPRAGTDGRRRPGPRRLRGPARRHPAHPVRPARHRPGRRGAVRASCSGFEERLARSSVVRDRSRTALTLGGLTIGLAMIVALGGVGQHARAAAAGWIADVIPGELVLTSIRPIAADEGVEADLDRRCPRGRPDQPDRHLRRRARRDAHRCGRGRRRRHGRRRPAQVHRRRPRRRARRARRRRRDDRPGRAWPSRLGLTGRRRSCACPTADGGLLDLRVVGIVERSIPGRSGEAMLVGWSDATTSLGVAGADVFAVRFAPGRARHRPGRPAQLGRPAGPRGRPARPDRGRHQRRARPDLRTVRRARGGRRPRRRAGHRQHADHERHRAGPRDRHPARGRDDPRPGLALGRRRGRRARARRGAPRDRARARGRRPDGRPGRRPARRRERDARGRSSAWRSSSASSWRCSRRPIRPAWRAGCRSCGPSSTSDAMLDSGAPVTVQ